MPQQLPESGREDQPSPEQMSSLNNVDGLLDFLKQNYLKRLEESVSIESIVDVSTSDSLQTLVQEYAVADEEGRKDIARTQAQFLTGDASDIRDFVTVAYLMSIDPSPFISEIGEAIFMERQGNIGFSEDLARVIPGGVGTLANHLEKPGMHATLKVMLNAVSSLMEAMQSWECKGPLTRASGKFFMNMHRVAEDLTQKNLPYLPSRQCRNIAAMFFDTIHNPENPLQGVYGASGSGSQYAYVHGKESYEERIAMGSTESFVAKKPYFPVAKGFIARYLHNQVESIASISNGTDSVAALERRLIQESDKTFADELYKDMARAHVAAEHIPGINFSNRSYRTLHQYHWIFDVYNFVEKGRGSFFFDFSRPELVGAHPVVEVAMADFNMEQLAANAADIRPVDFEPVESFWHRIYPESEPTDTQKADWRLLTSLGMHKNIEDDFGIDIAEFDLWIQRLFLEYIDSITSEDIPKISAFLAGPNKREHIVALTSAAYKPDIVLAIHTIAKSPAADSIFTLYTHLVEQAEETADAIIRECSMQNIQPMPVRHKIFQHLLNKGYQLLKQAANQLSTNTIDVSSLVEELRVEFLHSSTQVQLLRHMVQLLPKADLNALNMNWLSTCFLEEDVPSHMLEPQLHTLLRSMVQSAFKQPSDVREFDACMKKQDTLITYSVVGEEILGMFASTMIEEVRYIDFYCTNKHGAVKGLAEATLRTAIHNLPADELLACVSSPQSSSFEAFIEHIGMVGFAMAEDGEYQEPYVRFRRVPTDAAFKSKNLTKEELLQQYRSHTSGRVHLSAEGTALHFVAVNVRDRTSLQKLFEYLNAEMGNKVLTRYFPLSSDRSEFLCVFEEEVVNSNQDAILTAFNAFHHFQEGAHASHNNSNDNFNMDTID